MSLCLGWGDITDDVTLKFQLQLVKYAGMIFIYAIYVRDFGVEYTGIPVVERGNVIRAAITSPLDRRQMLAAYD